METCLLLSGLSVKSGNSFHYQFTLLQKGLATKGLKVRLAGSSDTGKDVYSLPQDALLHKTDLLPLTEDDILLLYDRHGFDTVIMLGYPGQFPFLSGGRTFPFSIYLWAQFSAPPRPGVLGEAAAVPLTPISRKFIELSGHRNLQMVIPHAVDTSVFSPSEKNMKAKLMHKFGINRSPVIGMAGANTFRKRFDVLIDAFAGLRESLDSLLLIKTDRKIWHGGYDLPGLLQRRGISTSAVLVTETLSDRGMGSLLSCLDLYVHTAEWEGFGIPVIEAMACGVPVLCCRGQGPGEIVGGGRFVIDSCRCRTEDGTLLYDLDPQMLSQHITAVLSDGDRLREESMRGRRLAESRYDFRVVSEQWYNLLTGKTMRR